MSDADADVTGTGTRASGTASTENARFVAGTILAGRYRIVTMLGRGGMGEVYKADEGCGSPPGR